MTTSRPWPPFYPELPPAEEWRRIFVSSSDSDRLATLAHLRQVSYPGINALLADALLQPQSAAVSTALVETVQQRELTTGQVHETPRVVDLLKQTSADATQDQTRRLRALSALGRLAPELITSEDSDPDLLVALTALEARRIMSRTAFTEPEIAVPVAPAGPTAPSLPASPAPLLVRPRPPRPPVPPRKAGPVPQPKPPALPAVTPPASSPPPATTTRTPCPSCGSTERKLADFDDYANDRVVVDWVCRKCGRSL